MYRRFLTFLSALPIALVSGCAIFAAVYVIDQTLHAWQIPGICISNNRSKYRPMLSLLTTYHSKRKKFGSRDLLFTQHLSFVFLSFMVNSLFLMRHFNAVQLRRCFVKGHFPEFHIHCDFHFSSPNKVHGPITARRTIHATFCHKQPK